MTPTNVLFTCAGLRVDMIEAFRAALADDGQGGLTIAADMDPLAPALYVADVRELVPPVADPAYVPSLLDLCRRHSVRAVVPFNDRDQVALAAARPAFADAGAVVIASDADVSERCCDKYQAHRHFEANGVPSPRTWLPEELPAAAEIRFPVLVKARRGFGSRDIFRARTAAELEFFLGYTTVEAMVQEVCPGEEFSIDLMSDLDARCLAAIPRSMIESKGGETIKGMSLDAPDLVAFGARVVELLGIKGPSTVQCFRTAPDRYEVTDVNSRFGGGFPLPVAAGGGYPSLVLALARGERPEPRLGAYRVGVTMTRFYADLTLADSDGELTPLGRGGALEPSSRAVG